MIFLGVAAKRTSEPTEQVEPPPPEDAPAGAEDDIPFWLTTWWRMTGK